MKSKEITQDMIENILSGDLPKDSKLPSESYLSEKYDCNRHTIRKVLEFLIERGYLRKIHNGSTYINGFPSNYALSLCSLFDLYSAKDIKTNVVKFEKKIPSDFVLKKLKIQLNEMVWHIVRVRYVKNNPKQIEYIYMPVSLFPDLSIKNCKASLLFYIECKMEYEISHGTKTISATESNDFENKIFNKTESSPTLQIENIGYLSTGRIYEYSINKHISNLTYYAKR